MSQSSSPIRDYTGVATRDLRAVILERLEGKTEGFAKRCGISPRSLHRILAEEQPFTSLSVADLVCCELDLTVNAVLTVIPACSFAAAIKMAADEFWTQEREATKQELHLRAKELVALRNQMLGEPTEKQRLVIERDRQWQADRYRARVA